MASMQGIMKFDLTSDDYKQFIKDLRNRAKDPNRTSHGKPVLPPPPQNPARAEYIDIELRAKDRVPVTVRIQRHDLYLIGYRLQNGQWYEFGRDDDPHRIPNSELLRFRGNYNNLGGLSGFPIGYGPLNDAINDLARNREGQVRRSALRLLAIMISESARFDKLLDIFAEEVRRRRESNIQTWMPMLIRGWGDLSERLLIEDSHAIGFRLPREPNGEENDLTREVGIRNGRNATECLGLLCGSHVPRGFVARRTLNVNDNDIQGMGQPLVEVFSVRIDNVDDEAVGDLYGSIRVTDGLGSFYLYNRPRNNYEPILPYDIASLTGPYRSISLCQFFSISLNLIDRDDDLSPDDEVSKGSFSWDIFYLSTTNYYGKRLFQEVPGQYGSAKVFYTMFEDAVQAEVDVVLIDGDGEDPAEVYGSLVARYDNYDYSTDGQKKCYQTRLFNKPQSKYIKIRPGRRIPLSRYMVAVPTTSSLIIEADLWDYDTFSPSDEIAKGVATFSPKTDGKSVHDITGQYGSVRVTVTWSALSREDEHRSP